MYALNVLIMFIQWVLCIHWVNSTWLALLTAVVASLWWWAIKMVITLDNQVQKGRNEMRACFLSMRQILLCCPHKMEAKKWSFSFVGDSFLFTFAMYVTYMQSAYKPMPWRSNKT